MTNLTKLSASFLIVFFGILLVTSISETGSNHSIMIGSVWSVMFTLLWLTWRRRESTITAENPAYTPILPLVAKEVAEKLRSRPKLITLKFSKKSEIVNVVLETIRADMSLHGGFAVIGDKKDAQLVKALIEIEYISQRELEVTVHRGICNVGREMFEWCRGETSYRRYPDHCLSTEALGYAMKHGVLSNEEIASIRFDHGEKPEEYIASAEGLFEKVMQQLRDGTAYFSIAESMAGMPDSGDTHCCCC